MDKRIEGLNKLISEAVDKGFFPGANYVLVVGDDTYYGSFGKKSLFPNVEENDIDTLYDMASCSKVLSTTSCVMKLLEQGKIRLYDKLVEYIPEFSNPDINIWDLLTHSSGLPADVPGGSRTKDKDLLFEKIMNVEVTYPKNTKIVYSDIGFMLLGYMIERVSGMTLDQYAKEYVFGPLEMNDTGYKPCDKNRCAPTEVREDDFYRGIVRGEVHDEKAYTSGGVAGHAGLFSCVKDVEKYMRMILNDGVYAGNQVLSKKTVDLLFTPQVEMKNGISLDPEKRGLGWIVKGNNTPAGDLASAKTICHTGFTGTSVVIDKENKIGFCLLSNRVHPSRKNILIIPFRAKLANYIMANFGG